MTIKTDNGLFNYSNITFTAEYKNIEVQYCFVINRLLMQLNIFLVQKPAFVEIYYVDVCPTSNIPTLHFVVKGNISYRELDTYLELWPVEFAKLFKISSRLLK